MDSSDVSIFIPKVFFAGNGETFYNRRSGSEVNSSNPEWYE